MRLISAIKPTGKSFSLTLGNYIGLIKNLENIKDKFDDIFIFIADLHALTFFIDPKDLNESSKKVAAFFLAILANDFFDTEKITLFLQSDIHEHSELNTILQNFLYFGEMKRMTQFKSKEKELGNEKLSLGFFAYPALMCADIVLYNADAVPVGEDQKQHIELTRNLVKRFNNYYHEEILVQPKAIINEIGFKIMDLKNPKVKMSKSSSKLGTIFIDDNDDDIKKKIMSATTDNEKDIKFDVKNKPGISNLLTIYASIKNISLKECENRFNGYKYVDFKKEVAIAVVEEIRGVREKYNSILKNEEFIKNILKKGAKKASLVAKETLKKVKKYVGFYEK